LYKYKEVTDNKIKLTTNKSSKDKSNKKEKDCNYENKENINPVNPLYKINSNFFNNFKEVKIDKKKYLEK
jgi:hypothetical protein